tara:strand:+ start:128 stop:358 length:231 start_codon:yes stop_codon:yes gene_type:complete
MIDTDKYKGHTEGPWSVEYPMLTPSEPNRKLIDDAPLLLTEVERLREAIADIATNMEAADASYMGGFIEDLWKVIE